MSQLSSNDIALSLFDWDIDNLVIKLVVKTSTFHLMHSVFSLFNKAGVSSLCIYLCFISTAFIKYMCIIIVALEQFLKLTRRLK